MTERVVNPLSAPNWSLQPEVTENFPHEAGPPGVSEAGLPLWTYLHLVSETVVVTLKVKVQVVSASLQTRLKASMVHRGDAVASTDWTAPEAGAGAAKAVAARTAATRVWVICMMAVV